jgi:hypothetical protein
LPGANSLAWYPSLAVNHTPQRSQELQSVFPERKQLVKFIAARKE